MLVSAEAGAADREGEDEDDETNARGGDGAGAGGRERTTGGEGTAAPAPAGDAGAAEEARRAPLPSRNSPCPLSPLPAAYAARWELLCVVCVSKLRLPVPAEAGWSTARAVGAAALPSSGDAIPCLETSADKTFLDGLFPKSSDPVVPDSLLEIPCDRGAALNVNVHRSGTTVAIGVPGVKPRGFLDPSAVRGEGGGMALAAKPALWKGRQKIPKIGGSSPSQEPARFLSWGALGARWVRRPREAARLRRTAHRSARRGRRG